MCRCVVYEVQYLFKTILPRRTCLHALSIFQGKNVMIWHVPNNLPIDEISNRAFLKYYTDNDFLKNYGSSLFSLYSNNASIDSAGA